MASTSSDSPAAKSKNNEEAEKAQARRVLEIWPVVTSRRPRRTRERLPNQKPRPIVLKPQSDGRRREEPARRFQFPSSL